jgi:S1-C subfamily serine protease
VVVVVRAKDAGVDGQGRVSDVGSGVVVSSGGKIMTAAHLVQGAEGIGVQFLGGRTVGARVVASELAADLSLIQLDQSRTSRSRPRPIWPGFASARAGSPVRLR